MIVVRRPSGVRSQEEQQLYGTIGVQASQWVDNILPIIKPDHLFSLGQYY